MCESSKPNTRRTKWSWEDSLDRAVGGHGRASEEAEDQLYPRWKTRDDFCIQFSKSLSVILQAAHWVSTFIHEQSMSCHLRSPSRNKLFATCVLMRKIITSKITNPALFPRSRETCHFGFFFFLSNIILWCSYAVVLLSRNKPACGKGVRHAVGRQHSNQNGRLFGIPDHWQKQKHDHSRAVYKTLD